MFNSLYETFKKAAVDTSKVYEKSTGFNDEQKATSDVPKANNGNNKQESKNNNVSVETLKLEKDLKNIQNEINKLNSDIDKNIKDIDGLKLELNHKYSEQSKLELKISKKKNTIDELKSEIDDRSYTFWIFNFRNKTTDVAELESELNNVYKEVEALEKDLKNMQNEIDKLKSDIDKKQKDIDKMKLELNHKYSEQAKLKSELNNTNNGNQTNISDEVNNTPTENDYIKWAVKNDYIKRSEVKGVYFHMDDTFKTYPVINYSGNIRDLSILSSDPSKGIAGDISLSNHSWIEINGAFDIWLYKDKNFKGNCVYIHNGKKSSVKKTVEIYASLQGSASSVIVKPAAIIDDKLIDMIDYDMGKLRDYMGRTVSIISLGNQNFALDDTGVQKSGTGYHIWTFTANNLNQQFKINSYGQLVRVGTELCLYYAGDNTLIQKEADGTDRKSLWCLDDENRLINISDTNKAIDISGATYENGVKLIVYPKHEGLNQKWKIVSIEGFSSLFVGSYNSTLTFIKLIGGLLIIFCFFRLLTAAKYDAIQRRQGLYNKNNI